MGKKMVISKWMRASTILVGAILCICCTLLWVQPQQIDAASWSDSWLLNMEREKLGLELAVERSGTMLGRCANRLKPTAFSGFYFLQLLAIQVERDETGGQVNTVSMSLMVLGGHAPPNLCMVSQSLSYPM